MEALPHLPEESSLPPVDRPAWPLERIRELLASRKPAKVLWALERAAAQRVSLEEEEVTGAAARLLDHDDEDVFQPALTVLRGFTGHPFAREVANVIARCLPSFGDGTLAQCLAVEALAKLAPADHAEAFSDALENSGDEDVRIAALTGIASGRGEGAIFNLLASMGMTSDAKCAALALAGLCDLRAAEFAERGAELFLLRFVGDGDDDDFSFSELCSDIEGALAGWMDLHWRVEDSLFHDDEEHVSRETRASVFLPTADPVGAGRSRGVLGPERMDRLFSLADDREHEALRRFVGDWALQAIGLASRENPAFGPLGQTLAGLVGSILEWDGFGNLEDEDRAVVLGFLGAVLAKGIRGHDIARELEDAGDNRAKLLELCRVDEDWVDRRAFELLARVLREEDAASLATSTDRTVSLRGLALLAAMDPARHARKALAALIGSPGPNASLFRGLVSVVGDAVLPALVEAARADPGQGLGLLSLALKLLGTEQARICLEHSFDALRGIPPLGLLDTAGATGSRLAVEKTVALIREAAFDITEAAEMDPGLTELRARVEACLEVLEIPGDVDEILAEALEESGRVLLFDEEELLGEDDDDDDDDGEAEVLRPRFDRDDPDLLDPVEDVEPVEPIVRDTPKVGRNDPCPCGSGKKHKKCCGKGS